MSKRYTAADFTNARFAEHPDGDWAVRGNQAWSLQWRTEYGASSDYHMAADGWVPVPTKPTITDPEIGAIADNKSDDWLDGFMAGYEKAGGTILEETTRERVARLITETLSETGIASLPEKAADRLISLGLVKDN